MAVGTDIDRGVSVKPLKDAVPQVVEAFIGLEKAVMTNGALMAKQKELIALTLGVATQCEPCISYHAKQCVQLGTSRAEVVEALGVCVMMGGGPKLQYASKALAAYDTFAASK